MKVANDWVNNNGYVAREDGGSSWVKNTVISSGVLVCTVGFFTKHGPLIVTEYVESNYHCHCAIIILKHRPWIARNHRLRSFFWISFVISSTSENIWNITIEVIDVKLVYEIDWILININILMKPKLYYIYIYYILILYIYTRY